MGFIGSSSTRELAAQENLEQADADNDFEIEVDYELELAAASATVDELDSESEWLDTLQSHDPSALFEFFPDMPCMKRVYRDKKASVHWSGARNEERSHSR